MKGMKIIALTTVGVSGRAITKKGSLLEVGRTVPNPADLAAQVTTVPVPTKPEDKKMTEALAQQLNMIQVWKWLSEQDPEADVAKDATEEVKKQAKAVKDKLKEDVGKACAAVKDITIDGVAEGVPKDHKIKVFDKSKGDAKKGPNQDTKDITLDKAGAETFLAETQTACAGGAPSCCR